MKFAQILVLLGPQRQTGGSRKLRVLLSQVTDLWVCPWLRASLSFGLSLHGLEHGSYIKAPNSGTQQPLATWENGPASKDPHFISAFEIKTLYASVNASGICYSSGKMKRIQALRPPPSALTPTSGTEEELHALGTKFVASPVADAWAAASGVVRFSEGTWDERQIPTLRKEPSPLTALASLPSAPLSISALR